MKLGIVGNEAAKFTVAGEVRARRTIRDLIAPLAYHADSVVVSGACHLGGVDIWAREIAEAHGVRVVEFPPLEHSWERGYKPRNLQIATYSDAVFSLSVDQLAPDFRGMRFPACYHCAVRTHVKSGGCWTVHQARRLGKRGTIVVVPNGE